MENPFSNMQIHIGTIRNNREEIEFRLLAYKIMIQTRKFSQSPNKEKRLAAFWNKESYWENKIYSIMKRWEARHPIIGIVLCTILGGILISLVAGIALEAIMMVL